LTGEHQVRKKTLKELQDIFQVLNSKLRELNKDAVRDVKGDLNVINENRLNQILQSNIKLKEKKRLLLTQIGYLRINIFTEYFERVKFLREKNLLNQAVELMHRHAEIAQMFIPAPKQSALEKRLRNFLGLRSIEPIEYLKKWQNAYETWFKQKPNQQKMDKKKLLEEFDKLKMDFLELYTFSFSVNNFPPLRNRRSDS
jgi:hypothetical protein